MSLSSRAPPVTTPAALLPPLLVLVLLAGGARAQSASFGSWAWDRASTSVPVDARSAHVAASDFATLVVSGGTTIGGARDGSSAVFAVTGAGGTAARATAQLNASVNGIAGALGLTSVASAAAALVWDDAAAAPPASDALFAYSGVGENGALYQGLSRMSLGAAATWSRLTVSGAALGDARSQAAAAFLPRCNQTSAAPSFTGCFVVFGGTLASGALSASLLVNYIPGTPAPATFANYAFALAPGFGTSPTPRYGHTLVASPDGTSAFLFGGTVAGGVTNDVYWLAASGFSTPTASELVDVALGRATSGAAPDSVASADISAVTDGVTTQAHNPRASNATAVQPGQNMCFQTASGGSTNPSIMIDLGAPTAFAAVQIYTRTDCASVAGGIAGQLACVSAMQGYQIWAGPSALGYSGVGNVQCAGAALDFAGGIAFVICPQSAARYVYLTLPGVSRVLTVCELQVLKSQPWTWRYLSGNAEAASGKASAAASMTSVNPVSPGEAFRAVDGFKTNDFRTGSCATTTSSGSAVVPGSFQQWTVDLGALYAVKTVTVWPAAFFDSTGTTNLYPNRTKNWYVYAGSSPTNALLNTLCAGPFNPAVGTPASPLSTALACSATARFVTIRRVQGPPASPADNDDTVAVCEVSVTVAGLAYQPSARTGHAAAQFRGDMVIFGGIDADAKLLSDIYFFDMFRQAFVPNAPSPLGSPPLGRTRASLTVLGANLLAVASGTAGSDPTALVDLLTFVPCAAITMTGVAGTPYCTRDKTACQYSCLPAYTNANPTTNGWVACRRDGTYYGQPTPCVLIAAGVVSVAATALTGANVGSVSVTWVKQGTPTNFRVTAAADPTYEVFDTFVLAAGSALPTPLWTWYDPTAGASGAPGLNKQFETGGSLVLGVQPTCDCVSGNSSASANCPFAYITTPPANLDPNNYIVETFVTLDPATNAFSQYTAGLALVDATTQLVQFEVGLSNDPFTALPRVGWATISATANQFSEFVDIPSSPAGVYLRIERSAARTLGGWMASWRRFPTDRWSNFGFVATTGNFFNPAAPASNLRPALVVRNSAGAFSTVPGFSTIKYADFSYFRFSGLACDDQGRGLTLPSTAAAATLSGLSPSGHYVVSVAGSYDGGLTFGPAASSPSVTIPAAATAGLASAVEVARGKSAFSSPVANGAPASPASLANDGNTNTTLLGAGGLPQCFRSLPVTQVTGSTSAGATAIVTPSQLRWTVDLGWDTDVSSVGIWNSASNSQYLTGFQVSVSMVADASRDIVCDMSATAVNLTSAPYFANITCGLHGRYVTVSAPAAPYNAVSPQDLRLCEVQVFAPNSCPVRPTPANGYVVSGCAAGSPYMAQCVQACSPGFAPVFGDAVSVCRGGSWDQPNLVCAATCGELLPPANAGSCTNTLVLDYFTGAAAAVQGRWMPLDQRQAFGTYWFADGDAGAAPGVLQASARQGCNSHMIIASESNAVEQVTGQFVAWASFSTSDQAGVAFRIQDIDNYYVCGADVQNLVLFCDVAVSGVLTRLAQAQQLDLRANTNYQLTVQVSFTTLTLSFAASAQISNCAYGSSCMYGTQIFSVVDDTFASGSAGLFANSAASFSWFEFDVPCNSCAGLAVGNTCTYLCKAGNSVGATSTSRSCNVAYALDNITSFAGFDGTPLVCSPLPPTFRSEVVSCSEQQPIDSPCGAPIDVVAPSPSMTVSYAITSGNTNNAWYVNSCSGQILVANASAVFYAILPSYSLIVAAVVTETASDGSTTTNLAYGNVTVQLLAVPSAPTMAGAQALFIPENTPAGAPVGQIACASPLPVTFALLGDGAQGRFLVSASGAVSVTPSAATLLAFPLNYEAQPNSWLLSVRCALSSSSALYSIATVNVTLQDADDAPAVATSVLVQLSESLVLAAGASPIGVALTPLLPTLTTDEDTNPAFLAPARPLSYSLIPPAQMQAVCTNLALNVNVGSATPVINPNDAPTSTGFFTNGSMLFSLTSAGAFSVAAAPAAPVLAWTDPGRAPSVFYGFVVLGAYQVCVNVTAAGSPWRLQVVPVGLVANLATRAIISGCSYPNPLSVAGGESVVCSVSNLNSFSDIVSATYGNAITQYTAACVVSAVLSTVTCTTAPGTGSAMRWTFVDTTFGGAFIAQTSTLVTRYAQPLVSSVSNNAACLTAGGTIVTFSGSNLGSVGALNASVPVVTVAVGASQQYACTYLAPGAPGSLSSTTAVSCAMGPGAGASLPVQILVSGQAYAPAGTSPQPTITFAAPVVTCVFVVGGNCTAPGTATLATSGGTAVIIQGSNFGPGTGEALSVSFGPITGYEYSFTSCANVLGSSQTQIACATPAATGTNLGVIVSVAGQAGARTSGVGALGISFSAPAVSAIDGPGVAAGGTVGGDLFYIEGSGFGAVTLPGTGSITVTYGPGTGATPRPYQAVGCFVSLAPPASTGRISCTTAPGTGRMASWLVVIAGGASLPFVSATASYGRPALISASFPNPLGLATAGSQVVTLTGENFGPATALTNSLLQAWFGVRSFGAATAGTQLGFTLGACTVTVAHTQVQCTAPAGAGAGLGVQLYVNGLASVQPSLNYLLPVVSQLAAFPLGSGNLSTAPDCSTPFQAYLVGSGFGPIPYFASGAPLSAAPGPSNVSSEIVTAVTYGVSGLEYSVTSFTHVSDSQILVSIGANDCGASGFSAVTGTGAPLYFRVTAGNQQSAAIATPAFAYPRALVAAAVPLSTPIGSATTLTLRARHVPFLDPLHALVVLLGISPSVAVLAPNAVTTAAGMAQLLNADGTYNISAALPSWFAGAGLPIRLGQQSLATGLVTPITDAASAPLFSYAGPQISGVTVTLAPWILQANLTLCPFTAFPANAAFNCSDPKIHMVVVGGSGFAPFDRTQDLGLPASYVDSVVRELSAATAGGNGTIWVPASTAASQTLLWFDKSRWSNTRLVAYTKALVGQVQVKLTTTGSAAAPQVSQAAFSDVSPAIGALSGSTSNLPTAGGFTTTPWTVLTIGYVNGLTNAIGVSVNVGGAPCPLVVGSGAAAQLVTNVASQVLALGLASGIWSLSCVVPPGQGSRAPVSIVRTESVGIPAEFFATGTVAYAPPAASAYLVLAPGASSVPTDCGKNGCAAQLDPGFTAYQASTVTSALGGSGAVFAACAGNATMRIRGVNLGIAPVVTVGDGIIVSGADIWPCKDGATYANTTCFEFRTPPGEGRGTRLIGASGFQVALCAADQCAPSAAFGFEGAIVSAVLSSSQTKPTNPLNGTVLTLLGRNFGVPNRGRDPGQSASTLRVSFALRGQAPFTECSNVVRYSDGNLTCVLQAGSGAGLDVHVYVQDGNSVSPAAFSYDAPTIAGVWVLALMPPAPTTVCVPQTSISPSTGLPITQTVCAPTPLLPPTIQDPLVSFPNAYVQTALRTAGPPGVRPAACAAGPGGCPAYRLTGDYYGNQANLVASGNPMDSGNLVVIAGANFGPPSPQNCPAMPWTFRPTSGYYFTCNNNEDFLGEGEVPASKVLLWTDTLVAFFTNAGIGFKDFEIVAGGQVAASKGLDDTKRVRFRYDPPQIFRNSLGVVTGLLPRVFDGDFDTTQPVQVLATNLGPVPIDFAQKGAALATCPGIGPSCAGKSGSNWFANPVPLNCSATNAAAVCAPRLPTAYIVLLVDRVCVANAFTVQGAPWPAAANCHGLLQSQSASALTFVPPEGVGANKQLLIRVADASSPSQVVDPIAEINLINTGIPPGTQGWFDYIATDPLPTITRCCGYALDQVIFSTPVSFAFQPPTVAAISPSSVRVGSTLDARNFPNVTIRGTGLGNPTRTELDMWPAGDRQLSVTVGPDVPCTYVARQRIIGPAGAETVLVCTVDISRVSVGYQPLVINVAGQTTPPYSLTSTLLDVLVTCETGFFGRGRSIGSGETCLPCPAQGAFCAGGLAYPRPLPGWYNMNASDSLSPLTQGWFSDVPRITCPTSAYLGTTSYYATGTISADQSTVTFSNGNVVSTSQIVAFGAVAVGNVQTAAQLVAACPAGQSCYFFARAPGLFAITVPRDTCIVPCPIPGACLGYIAPAPGALGETGTDNRCAAGYRSLPPYYSCADCAPGYFKLAQSCAQCPSQPQALFIGYIVLVLVATSAAWLASRAGLQLAVASLGIDFMQEVAMLAYSKVAWTPDNRGLFYVFSAFYLNQEIIAPECTAGPVPFGAKFFFTMFLPVAVAALLAAVSLVFYFFKLVVLRRRREERSRHAPLLIGACLSIWSLLYIYEAEMDMQVFNCAPLSPPTRDAAGAVQNFLSVQHEPCSMVGGVFSSLQWYAVAGFVVYVAGFPCGVAYWLWSRRELCMEDQLLRAKGAGDDRLTGPQTYETRKAFGALYFQFKPDYFWWYVVVLVRKFALLAVILVAFNQSANYQMAASLVVVIVAYALHVRVAPYMGPGQFDAVLRDHSTAALTDVTHARLRTSIIAVETRGARGGRQKSLVGTQGQIDRAAVLGVLRGAFFDYNSVAAAMLFAEVVIILMGILVDIANSDPTYANANIAASAVISAVAAIAIVYYAVVAVTDAVVVFAERGMTEKRRAAQALKRKQKLGSDTVEGEIGKLSRRGSRLSLTAESFVGAITTDDRRLQLDVEAKARREAAVSGTPLETSMNPMMAMMAARGAGASSSKIEAIKKEVKLAEVDPAALEQHLAALQGFGDLPPPTTLWPGIRDAAASAMRAQSNLMAEVAELKRALAESQSGAMAGGGGGGGGRLRASLMDDSAALDQQADATGAAAGVGAVRVSPGGGLSAYARRNGGGVVGKRASFQPKLA